MNNPMNYKWGDVYSVGVTTRQETAPDAVDKESMVDNQEDSAKVDPKPEKGTPVLVVIGLLVGLAVILGVIE